MYAVFYDLETTTKNTIGQILNYSFILVDDEMTPVGELSGLVKMSRLQLPEPGAILANRTDVIEHQKVAVDNEPTAMKKIEQFLSKCIQTAQGAIAFVGYNSSRFDLGYLRTSFIRNGINPYFKGLLSSRDLLHAVQKAYLTSAEFRDAVQNQCRGDKRLSLSLQTVSHALGLLEGVQAHESREDVLLTIRLAVWLKEHCQIDVRTYEAYEAGPLHSTVRSGSVYEIEEPQYDLLERSHIKRVPMCLLDENKRASLWVNLERYAEDPSPRCISWRQTMKHAFFTSGRAVAGSDVQELARKALGQFKKVTLNNYFEKSDCDIEQDIYRLDFDAQDVYYQALREGKKELLAKTTNPDAKKLWVRYQLANADVNLEDARSADLLRQYALYRYGGKLQLVKTIRNPQDPDNFHPKLSDMMAELVRLREGAVQEGNDADIKLLDSLEGFYRSSEIVRVAGAELVPGWTRFAPGVAV
jgi:exonuclease I